MQARKKNRFIQNEENSQDCIKFDTSDRTNFLIQTGFPSYIRQARPMSPTPPRDSRPASAKSHVSPQRLINISTSVLVQNCPQQSRVGKLLLVVFFLFSQTWRDVTCSITSFFFYRFQLIVTINIYIFTCLLIFVILRKMIFFN